MVPNNSAAKERPPHETFIEIETTENTACTALIKGTAIAKPGDTLGYRFEADQCHLFTENGTALKRLKTPGFAS